VIVISIARTFLAAGRGFLNAQDPEKIALHQASCGIGLLKKAHGPFAHPFSAASWAFGLGLLSSLNHDAPQARKFSDCHNFIQQRRKKEPLYICL
jgi:hypothetical protein